MVRLFPPSLRTPAFDRHLLKEFVECLALEWISRSAWAKHLTFIGGTCLRRDVVHLLFYRERAATILDFPAFVSAL